jgi:hypothetical protein
VAGHHTHVRGEIVAFPVQLFLQYNGLLDVSAPRPPYPQLYQRRRAVHGRILKEFSHLHK